MMAVEERLAHVEGLVAGQALLLGDLRAAVTSLEGRVDRRFDQFENRLALMDGRIAALDHKVDAKIDALSTTFDARFDALDRRLDVRFQWMLGVMVTLVAAVVAAMLTR